MVGMAVEVVVVGVMVEGKDEGMVAEEVMVEVMEGVTVELSPCWLPVGIAAFIGEGSCSCIVSILLKYGIFMGSSCVVHLSMYFGVIMLGLD